MATAAMYPVRVEAALDPRLSRWLWVVKWLLVIPHYIVLAFLWVAFVLLSIVAFFSILFTGHYPRSIFEFNVGVLRWSWRVTYYAYGALGTDRYPPFSLGEEPDYPARLDIAYPEHLSRGLVLVKWWLLAIPHYIVTGLFLGGGAWAAGQAEDWHWTWSGGGLIAILVLIAGVTLAVTGNYPRSIFDFVLGMNRWVLRVAAYAGLMTDDYPPFRLDLGGHEPGATLTVGPGGGGTAPAPGEAPPEQPTTAPPPGGWSGGRIASVVAGSLLVLLSVGMLGGGGAVLWADRTQRVDGYLTSSTTTFASGGYALASDRLDLHASGPDWGYRHSLLGDVRIRVTATQPGQRVFVGIAPAGAAEQYLAGVQYTTVSDFADHHGALAQHSGGPPATRPALARIWVAQATGTGTQTIVWPVEDGNWRVVAMNADASRGLSVRADVGATLSWLPWLAGGLLGVGVLFLAAGVVLIVIPVRRAGRVTT